MTLLILGAVVACTAGPPEPIEITLNEENCSFCRMAVSQREFAAQIVTVTGSFDTFDDIGCLRDWIEEHHPADTAGIFVVDYEMGQWIDARTASYVLTKQLPTPMGSGLCAYQDKRLAESAAAHLEGRVLQWTEILAEAKHE
jgi:copper chaperone NosL